METQQPSWSLTTRIIFRLCFVYFLLYIAPFPFTFVPYLAYAFKPFFWITSEATEFFGPVLFGSDYRSVEFNGSGDSSYSYTQVAFYGGLALLITLIWSIVDRRESYPRLSVGLNVVLRYYLAMQLLSYGFIKIFPSQFPSLPESWLNQTFGEASPMRLFWAFMGYSKVYTIFSGLAEATAGLLLLFRRTKLLGAMVASMVMLHVVVLNFSYDIPVKILSLHLFMIAVVIMAPDLRRLIRFFILNKVVDVKPVESYFINRRNRIAGYVFKVYVVALIILPSAYRGWQQYQAVREHQSKTSDKPRLTGAYEVETFTLNNDTLPPREDDTRRWRSVMISARSVQIQSMDGFTMAWNCLINDSGKDINILSRDGFTSGTFSYTIDGQMLKLAGTLNDNQVVVTATKKSDNAFLLTNRGFHWVNESPFNQ